ncbi:MAG TPA: hypothetical protein VL201_03810 [Patescibacteria group bacterium]|nr:hypothetical protein [Patescibacteria group bacterium]
MNFKNMFFIIVLPLSTFSSEKFYLTTYPNLKAMLENVDNCSSTHITCINQYIAIPKQKVSTRHNNEQKNNIILGLYLFSASAIPTEKASYIFEANKAFTMAFPYSSSFNFSSNSTINDVCNKLENALWWDYYVKKIPFVQSILHFMRQIGDVNKANNKDLM